MSSCRNGSYGPLHDSDGDGGGRSSMAAVHLPSAHDESTFLLHDRNEKTRDYGRIQFERPSMREDARFIRVGAHPDQAERLVHLFDQVWKVKGARVLISITGGAQGLDLSSHVTDVIFKGLVNAARKTYGWLITGGMNTGVMQLLGDEVRRQDAIVPVVGVADWARVYGNDQLMSCCQSQQSRGSEDSGTGYDEDAGHKDREYFYNFVRNNDNQGASIQPHHTHFVLVDTAPNLESTWGNEIPFRSSFEAAYRKTHNVPEVVVVINGGPNSLQIILEAVRADAPVVLVKDSGGAAYALAQYIASEGKDRPVFDESGKRGLKYADEDELAKAGGKIKWEERIRQQMAEILEEGRRVIHSSAVQHSGDGESELELVLLKAIVFDTNGEIRGSRVGGGAEEQAQREADRVLDLAITWGRREIVEQCLLERRRTIRPHGPPAVVASRSGTRDSGDGLGWALSTAIKNRHADIADHLLERGYVNVCQLNLVALWKDWQGNRNKFDCQVELPPISRDRVLPTLNDSLNSLGSAVPLPELWKQFHDDVVPFMRRACELPDSVAQDMWPPRGADGPEPWKVRDVFFWAVFTPNMPEPLARVLWRHSDEPIRAALVASYMATKLAAMARRGPEDYEARARLYERWAVGVVENCQDENDARAILQRHFTPASKASGGTSMQLALRLGRRAFVAHAHAQSLVDAWWRGDVHTHGHSARTGASAPATCFGCGDREWCLAAHPPPNFWRVILYTVCLTLPRRFVRMESVTDAAGDEEEGGAAGATPRSETHRRSRPWRAQMLCFFRAPCTKFNLRMFCYALFLIQYVAVLVFDDGSPHVSVLELVFCFWAIGNGVDVLHQLLEATLHSVPFFGAEYWRYLDAVVYFALFPAVICLRWRALVVCSGEVPAQDLIANWVFIGYHQWARAGAVEDHATAAVEDHATAAGAAHQDGVAALAYHTCGLTKDARIVLACTAIPCFFRFLANFREDKELGVLIYVIQSIVVNDVRRFVVLIFFVLSGFALAFGGLAPARPFEMKADPDSPFMLPVWNMFDMSDVTEEFANGRSQTPWLSLVVLAVYLFVAQVLLVNVLIAMMNSSFMEARQHTNEQWAHSRAVIVEELQLNFPVPPPISLPFIVLNFLWRAVSFARALLWRLCCTSDVAAVPASTPPHKTDCRLEHVGRVKSAPDKSRRKQLQAMRAFLEHEDQEANESMNMRVKQTLRKTQQVVAMLEAREPNRQQGRDLFIEAQEHLKDGDAPAEGPRRHWPADRACASSRAPTCAPDRNRSAGTATASSRERGYGRPSSPAASTAREHVGEAVTRYAPGVPSRCAGEVENGRGSGGGQMSSSVAAPVAGARPPRSRCHGRPGPVDVHVARGAADIGATDANAGEVAVAAHGVPRGTKSAPQAAGRCYSHRPPPAVRVAAGGGGERRAVEELAEAVAGRDGEVREERAGALERWHGRGFAADEADGDGALDGPGGVGARDDGPRPHGSAAQLGAPPDCRSIGVARAAAQPLHMRSSQLAGGLHSLPHHADTGVVSAADAQARQAAHACEAEQERMRLALFGPVPAPSAPAPGPVTLGGAARRISPLIGSRCTGSIVSAVDDGHRAQGRSGRACQPGYSQPLPCDPPNARNGLAATVPPPLSHSRPGAEPAARNVRGRRRSHEQTFATEYSRQGTACATAAPRAAPGAFRGAEYGRGDGLRSYCGAKWSRVNP